MHTIARRARIGQAQVEAGTCAKIDSASRCNREIPRPSTRPRPRRARTPGARGGARRARARALPRAPDLPLDLPARRHRHRRDDRPLARAARRRSPREFTLTTPDARRTRDARSTAPRSSCCASPTARQIESVFIPDTPAMTFCISTQVGCAMACAFCLTGKMGLVRNLTAGEIVGQVRVLADALDMRDKHVQHRADGHGRAAAQLRRDDEGAADPRRRARLRDVAAPDHAVDRRPAAGARAAGAASR